MFELVSWPNYGCLNSLSLKPPRRLLHAVPAGAGAAAMREDYRHATTLKDEGHQREE